MRNARFRPRGALAVLAALAVGACSAAIDHDFAASPSADDLVVVGPGGVAALTGLAPAGEETIEAAMPGFDAMAVTMSTETASRGAFALFRDGRQVLQVVPSATGAVAAVHGVGADVRGPSGERIGMTLKETGIPRSACRPGTANWAGMPICTVPGAPAVTLVFAVAGVPAGALPADGLLAAAALQRIIWTAPGGTT